MSTINDPKTWCARSETPDALRLEKKAQAAGRKANRSNSAEDWRQARSLRREHHVLVYGAGHRCFACLGYAYAH